MTTDDNKNANGNKGTHGSGRPVLLGVDGSEAGYKAAWWAANYAKHSHLSLQIVVAYSLPSYAAVSFDATYTAMGDDNAAYMDAQDILGKAKGIAVEQGLAPEDVMTLVVTGDPASVFVELSRNYDLIVIGNRGKGGLAERLLGTTSSTLPAYAYCPVVVVPLTDDKGNTVHLSNTLTNVIVSSDESRWGKRALDIAGDLAAGWSAKLTVVSAAPKPDTRVGEDIKKALVEDLNEEQSGRLAVIQKAHPDLEIETKAVIGSAVNTVLAESENADIIVVGSRGRGGLTGLLLGSKSQSLIQHSSKPVYVVPRKFVDRDVWKGDTETVAFDEISNGVVRDVDVEPVKQATVEHLEATIDPDSKPTDGETDTKGDSEKK